jgi:hypothetical protein
MDYQNTYQRGFVSPKFIKAKESEETLKSPSKRNFSIPEILSSNVANATLNSERKGIGCFEEWPHEKTWTINSSYP